MAYLALRTTGACEFSIPEWMFDADYPGHDLRRLKDVSLSIPAVVGDYTGVHATLTLINSHTRADPKLLTPIEQCCDVEGLPDDGYRRLREGAQRRPVHPDRRIRGSSIP